MSTTLKINEKNHLGKHTENIYWFKKMMIVESIHLPYTNFRTRCSTATHVLDQFLLYSFSMFFFFFCDCRCVWIRVYCVCGYVCLCDMCAYAIVCDRWHFFYKIAYFVIMWWLKWVVCVIFNVDFTFNEKLFFLFILFMSMTRTTTTIILVKIIIII